MIPLGTRGLDCEIQDCCGAEDCLSPRDSTAGLAHSITSPVGIIGLVLGRLTGPGFIFCLSSLKGFFVGADVSDYSLSSYVSEAFLLRVRYFLKVLKKGLQCLAAIFLFVVFLAVVSSVVSGASASPPDGRGPVTVDYVYDVHGRLKSVSYPDAGKKGVRYLYSYDAAGNRTRMEVGGVDDRPVVTILSAQAKEGQPLILQLRLSSPAPRGAKVSWQVLKATGAKRYHKGSSRALARAYRDYPYPQTGTVSFAEGGRQARIKVRTLEDKISPEANELVYVRLHTPVGVRLDPDALTGIGTIVDGTAESVSEGGAGSGSDDTTGATTDGSTTSGPQQVDDPDFDEAQAVNETAFFNLQTTREQTEEVVGRDVVLYPLANDKGTGKRLVSARLLPTTADVPSWRINLTGNGKDEIILSKLTTCGQYKFEYDMADSKGGKDTAIHTLTVNIKKQAFGRTVINCEAIGSPVFTVSDAKVEEGGQLRFTVTRHTAIGDQKKHFYGFDYYTQDGTAKAGSDYAGSGTKTSPTRFIFPAGDKNTHDIVVNSLRDEDAGEGAESMRLYLEAAGTTHRIWDTSKGRPVFRASATGTITDRAAPVTISVADAAPVSEGGTLVFSVLKSGPGAARVSYEAVSGSADADDYRPTSGTLSFGSGSGATQAIKVPTIEDDTWELAETVVLRLHSPTGGAMLGRSRANGSIENDDGTPIVNIWNRTVEETDSGTHRVPVTIWLKGGTSQEVYISYRTVDGTATAGEDYQATSGTIPIEAGKFKKTIYVTIMGDTKPEADETFRVIVDKAVHARVDDNTPGTITIKNDDAAAAQTSGGTPSGPTVRRQQWGDTVWSGVWGVCHRGTQVRTQTGTQQCRWSTGGTCGSRTVERHKDCSDELVPPRTQAYSYGSWSSWSGSCGGTQTRSRTRTCRWSTGESCGVTRETDSRYLACPPPPRPTPVRPEPAEPVLTSTPVRPRPVTPPPVIRPRPVAPSRREIWSSVRWGGWGSCSGGRRSRTGVQTCSWSTGGSCGRRSQKEYQACGRQFPRTSGSGTRRTEEL